MLRMMAPSFHMLNRIAAGSMSVALLLGAMSCTKQESAQPNAQTTSNTSTGGGKATKAASSSAQSLESDVKRLWEARLVEDWNVVFEYQQFRNAVDTTAAEFAKWSKENEPFVIKSYEISDVVVDGDFGWTEIDYVTSVRKFPDLPPTSTRRQEKWERIDGAWKLVPPTELSNYPDNPKARDLEAEKELLARFEESWKLRADRDWNALYQMTDPQARNDFPEDEYTTAKDSEIYLDYDIKWINVIGDKGRIRIVITHKINDPNLTKLPPTDIMIDEPWVKRDGQWYLDIEKGSSD